MAMGTEPRFPATINTQLVDITVGDTTTEETLFTAGADGARIDSIIATTDEDTADCIVVLSVSDGTITMPLGEVTVIHNSTQSVDLLADVVGLDINGSFFLKGGWTLTVALKTTITSTKTCWIKAEGGDY